MRNLKETWITIGVWMVLNLLLRLVAWMGWELLFWIIFIAIALVTAYFIGLIIQFVGENV